MASRRRRSANDNSEDEEEDDAFASASGSEASGDEAAKAKPEGNPPNDAGAAEEEGPDKVQEEIDVEKAPGRGTGMRMDQPEKKHREAQQEWKPKIREQDGSKGESKDADGEEGEKDEQDGKDKDEEPTEGPSAKAPRDGRYFLHDDRGKEDDGEEPKEEEEDPKGKGKGKKQRDKSAEDDGPWSHDKFHELMEAPNKSATRRNKWDDQSWEKEDKWSGGGRGGGGSKGASWGSSWDEGDSWKPKH